ncbi:MAG: hypothetical protein WBM77_07340 [Maribacter sp.]
MEIIDELLENKLLFNAMLSQKKGFIKDPGTGELKSTLYTLIIGKTKSLLFNSIYNLLTERYGDSKKMPSLYCLPIVYMDPERAEALSEQTMQV